jgi:hypothetical protein
MDIAGIQAAVGRVLAGIVIAGRAVKVFDREPSQSQESLPCVSLLQEGGSSSWAGPGAVDRREKFNLGCRWPVGANDVSDAQVHVAALHDEVRARLRANPDLEGSCRQLHFGEHTGPDVFSQGAQMYLAINQQLSIEFEEV